MPFSLVFSIAPTVPTASVLSAASGLSFLDAGIVCLLLVAIIALVAYYVIGGIRESRRLRKRLARQFGATPKADLKMEQVDRYWRLKEKHEHPTRFVDDRSWDDLDMDSVFARINACQTSVGDEYLYALLREPCFEPAQLEQLEQREKLIEWLDTNPDSRLDVQLLLEKTGRAHYNELAALLYGGMPVRLRHPTLYPVLACLPPLFLLVFVLSLTLALNPAIGLLGVTAACALNGAIHYRVERQTEHMMGTITYLSNLLWSAEKILSLLGQKSGIVDNNVIAGLRDSFKRFSFFRGTLSGLAKRTGWYNELEAFREFGAILLLTRVRAYNRLTRAVERNAPVLRQLFQSLGELDVALAILSFRHSLARFCLPRFTEGFSLEASELTHPLLTKPVPNSVTLTQNTLLTGSNASGKSTFVKAVGINTLLAQTINTCTAASFKAPMRLVVTSMAVRDNIIAGESYFIAEIRSLKRLLKQAEQHPCLCLIDEILKGTNTVERIAASVAVLNHFPKNDSICLAATHDVELTSLLASRFENFHFEEQVSCEGVNFDYLLRPGPSKTRNAIKLLETFGFGPATVQEALALVKTYEATGNWPR
jgi:hypothetical protein